MKRLVLLFWVSFCPVSVTPIMCYNLCYFIKVMKKSWGPEMERLCWHAKSQRRNVAGNLTVTILFLPRHMENEASKQDIIFAVLCKICSLPLIFCIHLNFILCLSSGTPGRKTRLGPGFGQPSIPQG